MSAAPVGWTIRAGCLSITGFSTRRAVQLGNEIGQIEVSPLLRRADRVVLGASFVAAVLELPTVVYGFRNPTRGPYYIRLTLCPFAAVCQDILHLVVRGLDTGDIWTVYHSRSRQLDDRRRSPMIIACSRVPSGANTQATGNIREIGTLTVWQPMP